VPQTLVARLSRFGDHARIPMSTTLRFAALAFCLLPLACAGTAEQRVPLPSQKVAVTNPTLTRIYFVREDTAPLQNEGIRVYDGETEIGELNRTSYLCWERPGGRTLGRAWYEAIGPGRGRIEGIADLECAAGSVYYFNVTIGRVDGKPKVEPLSAEDGRRFVAERRPAKTQ